jgi:hypothetical protein
LAYLAKDQDYWARGRYWPELQGANWLYRTNIFRESANNKRDPAETFKKMLSILIPMEKINFKYLELKWFESRQIKCKSIGVRQRTVT